MNEGILLCFVFHLFPLWLLKLASLYNQASMTYWLKLGRHYFVAFDATEEDVLFSSLAAVACRLVCFPVSFFPSHLLLSVKCHFHSSWRSVCSVVRAHKDRHNGPWLQSFEKIKRSLTHSFTKSWEVTSPLHLSPSSSVAEINVKLSR